MLVAVNNYLAYMIKINSSKFELLQLHHETVQIGFSTWVYAVPTCMTMHKLLQTIWIVNVDVSECALMHSRAKPLSNFQYN